MKVNFYWSGKNWEFINRLTIMSHIRVGHEVIMWVNEKSDNEYWIDDLPVQIFDAGKHVNTKRMLKVGWNTRTISTIFQYSIMYETGEYTADCDALALKHWPDVPLVLCPEGKNLISSVGVLRVPKKHAVLVCANRMANRKWGNVKIFSRCCRKFRLGSTYETDQFYPVTYRKGQAYKSLLMDSEIPESYSYHIFNGPYHKNIKKIDHNLLKKKKYKDSLLKKLSDWSFGDEYCITRKEK